MCAAVWGLLAATLGKWIYLVLYYNLKFVYRGNPKWKCKRYITGYSKLKYNKIILSGYSQSVYFSATFFCIFFYSVNFYYQHQLKTLKNATLWPMVAAAQIFSNLAQTVTQPKCIYLFIQAGASLPFESKFCRVLHYICRTIECVW